MSHNTNHSSEVSAQTAEPKLIEKALDSNVFKHLLDSEWIPIRAAAVSVVVVHALSKAVGHPEYLEGF